MNQQEKLRLLRKSAKRSKAYWSGKGVTVEQVRRQNKEAQENLERMAAMDVVASA